ncbi:MAG: NUDIX domain-containing protein [Saccharothrix sp.]|nr:NUDIX domain-containing protein [Saccharothrix sp.]
MTTTPDRDHHAHERLGEPRPGARVLLLDDAELVLLIHAHDPHAPDHRWWELPGGGIGDGESSADACVRELTEETGLADVKVGPLIWRRRSVFHYKGRDHHRTDDVHLARLVGDTRTATAWTANERTTVLGERWWTLADIETATAAGELFVPRALPTLLADVLSGRHRGVIEFFEDTRSRQSNLG